MLMLHKIKKFVISKTLSKLNKNYYRKFSKGTFASFPKSGRTWVRLMFAKYVSDLHNVKPMDMNLKRMHKKNKNIQLVLFTHIDGGFYKRPWNYKAYYNEIKNKKIILLVRNPKDVVVSYFFHMKKRMNKFDGDIKQFIRNKDLGIQRIVEYMNKVYEKKNVCSDFKIIKYENIKKNCKKEMKKILQFFDCPINEILLQKTVDFGNFENMKKMEKNDALNNTTLRPKNVKDEETYKVRKGKINGYLDYLDDKDIEYLDKEISKLNKIFDYAE